MVTVFIGKMTKKERHDLIVHFIEEALMDVTTSKELDDVNDFISDCILDGIITFSEADSILNEFVFSW